VFTQVRGGRFTYIVNGDTLTLSRTNQNLSKATFARALERCPLAGPGELQDLRGPSYLFAILTDPRISGCA
jgi:hypothetical protein